MRTDPVHLAYHCYSPGGGTLVFDGVRTSMPLLRACSAIETDMRLEAPSVRGAVRFRLTLVQEAVAWLDAPPHHVFATN